MSALIRAAEAEENSRVAIETYVSALAALRTTVAEGHAARARARALVKVRIQTQR